MNYTSPTFLSTGAFATMLAFCSATTGSFAQSGSLDPGFATAGIGTYLPESSLDRGYDILTLADNSMLVCGPSTNGGFLTHILEDGEVDASFGETSGYMFFDFEVDVIALAADQSIYVAGASQQDMLLAHLSASGIPDADFGSGGVVNTAVTNGHTTVMDMRIQPDGKLVGTGYGDFPFLGYNSHPFFVRYLPDGSLDTGFNGTGIISFATSSIREYMAAVAFMDDGSIVGAGYSITPDNAGHVLLIKLSAEGAPDLSFGTAGMLSPSFGGVSEHAFGMIVNDGSIYLAGDTYTDGDFDAYLAKFNADGTADISFGTDGSTVSDFNSFDYLTHLIAQPDGKIVACGATNVFGFNFSALLLRYATTGLLDPTFGDGGKTITNIGIFTTRLNDIALQPDGKFVVTGDKEDVENIASAIVVRYLGDGAIGIASNERSTDQFTVFPNPVAGTSATLRSVNAEGAEVWISDMQGRSIGKRIHVPKGGTSVELEVKDLSAGMYLVNVLLQGSTTTFSMQMIK